MLLAFELSMPGRNSWDGRWSGEDRRYIKIESFSGVKGGARAAQIIASGPYHYAWSDGWRAMISVRQITAAEARKLRKRSAGFCGYDWMVETIRLYGQPMATHELKAFLEQQKSQSLGEYRKEVNAPL